MDGLAPSPRRSDRPMVSRDAGRGGDGRRRRPGGFGTLQPTDDSNLSLGRRIGVLVVLAALGGAIVLAAGGVGGNHPVTPIVSPSAGASAGLDQAPGPLASPPTAAPAITPPKVTLVTTRTITLRVTVPEPGTSMSGLEVRIYRNSKKLASQKVTEMGLIKVRGVPLRRGSNKLTATLANEGGEGPRSNILTITLDDQVPKITVKSPKSGATLNHSRIIVRGKTEAGLVVTGKNSTLGSQTTATADASGAFVLEFGLKQGRNSITLRTRDAAGNRGMTPLVIVRGDGHTSVTLTVSPRKILLKSLPSTLNASVTVLDADGRPIKGATVVFTISPPGLLTATYPTTTASDGTASWSGIRLSRTGATKGDGIVTARVVVPNGSAPSRTVHFQVG